MLRSLFLLLALGLLVPAYASATCAGDGVGRPCCEAASTEVSLSHPCGMPSCEAAPAAGLAQDLPSAAAQVHFDAAVVLVSDGSSPEASPTSDVMLPAGALSARAAPELALLRVFRN